MLLWPSHRLGSATQFKFNFIIQAGKTKHNQWPNWGSVVLQLKIDKTQSIMLYPTCCVSIRTTANKPCQLNSILIKYFTRKCWIKSQPSSIWKPVCIYNVYNTTTIHYSFGCDKNDLMLFLQQSISCFNSVI